ncbi:hypothetical protein D8B26_005695 [Coccidioides posadasii str. Silveira]|uniref:uncharacterized protein n=1 Tax=Coccidioides posadasii (strain RMSCC 757 / Silveira) TaxID=443226 RepID=UPI001BEF246F|nr:hypothetical protein D8B26_005695 [Coccidioides posadasii str. Silveira]
MRPGGYNAWCGLDIDLSVRASMCSAQNQNLPFKCCDNSWQPRLPVNQNRIRTTPYLSLHPEGVLHLLTGIYRIVTRATKGVSHNLNLKRGQSSDRVNNEETRKTSVQN